MEINRIGISALEFLKKYRYIVLLLLVGIALMLMPSFNATKGTNQSATSIAEQNTEFSIGEELEAVLSDMDGAGEVKVMVSVAKGKHTTYQTDTDVVQSDSDLTQKVKTVLITQSDKSQSGLINRIDPPQYLGVIVLCQGADSAAVRFAIVDAVAKVTGLGTDCISVLKMK